jgi:hypothetical protein
MNSPWSDHMVIDKTRVLTGGCGYIEHCEVQSVTVNL